MRVIAYCHRYKGSDHTGRRHFTEQEFGIDVETRRRRGTATVRCPHCMNHVTVSVAEAGAWNWMRVRKLFSSLLGFALITLIVWYALEDWDHRWIFGLFGLPVFAWTVFSLVEALTGTMVTIGGPAGTKHTGQAVP